MADLPHNTELLRQVAAGDQQAFDRLVSMYWDRVFSHALTYTRAYEEAEEITQDIFLKIWNNREKLTGINDFLDYLFILGRNHIVSSMRRRIIRTTAVDPEHRVAEELAPDKQLEIRQLNELIAKGIDQLPPQQQKVFRLARLEGLPYEEIGQHLNISRHTVRFHMVMAFNFLREYLKKAIDP